jgi:GTP-binding protein
MMHGVVAIVGRPNVGKSTLFNRLTRNRTAIVDDQPGVTRDRIYGVAPLDREGTDNFVVIDTGGYESDNSTCFQPFTENLVWQQTQQAIAEADVIVFVMDGSHGLHYLDEALINFLREKNCTIIYAVNKIDGREQGEGRLWDFLSLAAKDDLLPISAAYRRGLPELLGRIRELLPHSAGRNAEQYAQEGTRIALIGRPNVGKSSLLNRLVGHERSLVSQIAGTTRDSIETPLIYNHQPYVIVDTAGVRRKTRVVESIEVQSVVRSLHNIEQAAVVVVVIEALEGLRDQDARLVNLAIARGKPVLIVVNKWDCVPNKTTSTAKDYANNLQKGILQDRSYIPVHFMSCLNNQRVHQVMAKIEHLVAQSNKKVPTALANTTFAKIVAQHGPQLNKNFTRPPKFYYVSQVEVAPPTFVVMCNVSKGIQESYTRYLVNSLRRELGFDSVPLRLIFRSKEEVKARKEQRAEAEAVALEE